MVIPEINRRDKRKMVMRRLFWVHLKAYCFLIFYFNHLKKLLLAKREQ